MFWCKQKLSWKADNGKSVEFIDKPQTVIGQDRKVKATFGEGYTKSGISNVLIGSNSRNTSPCSGVVFATKVGTFVLIGRNIDCCNYVNALDANLWPGVCKHFAGKHFF